MIDLKTENLIPLVDVLSFLPISKPTLRRWAKSGKLETVHAGRRVFTSREAVMRLLQHGPQPVYGAPLPPSRKQTRRQEMLKQVDAEWAALTA